MISTVSNSIGVEAVRPPRVTPVLPIFETVAVPEAITVPLKFTTAIPLAVKSPVVRLTVELKPLTAAVRFDSLGSRVTESADRLTKALSKFQAPFTLLAFNSDTVTVSDVNSSNL